MKLSVVIPAYNEERRLPKTLKSIGSYLKNQEYEYEIVVVNDGSKDRTADVVRSLSSEINNLRLIDNKENHGKGFVVRQGLIESLGDYRLFTDADNSTSVDHIEKMWPEFERGFDIILGSREMKESVLDPPQPSFRRMTGAAFRLLTNIFVGLWKIRDTQCGFKGFTKDSVEDVLPRCKIDRFSFDAEILVVAKKLNYRIKEIPITWENDLESKVSFKSMVKMGLDLIKIRINLIKKVYEKKET